MAFIKSVFGSFLMVLGIIGLGGGILGGGWLWAIPGVVLLAFGWFVFSPNARSFAYGVEKRKRVHKLEEGMWDTKINNEAAQEAIQRELKRRQRYGE